MPTQYMKNLKWLILSIVVIIITALVFNFFFREAVPEQREFRGMFVSTKGDVCNGHIHQAQKESHAI